MLRERARFLGSLLAVFDLVIVAVIELYVTLTFDPQSAYDILSTPSFLAAPWVFLIALHNFGAYRSFRVSALREEALLIIRSVIVGGAGMVVVAGLTPHSLPERPELMVLLVFVFGALYGGRLCL